MSIDTSRSRTLATYNETFHGNGKLEKAQVDYPAAEPAPELVFGTVSAGATQVYNGFRTMHDYVDPNFFVTKPVDLPIWPMTYKDETILVIPSFTFRYKELDQTYRLRFDRRYYDYIRRTEWTLKGSFPVVLPPFDSVYALIEETSNKLQVELRAELNEAYSNLYVTLAEMGETVKMFQDRGKGMFTNIRDNIIQTGKPGKRKPRRYNAFAAVSGASDVWMEARYAVRPTCYDLSAILQAFNELRYTNVRSKVNRGAEFAHTVTTENLSTHYFKNNRSFASVTFRYETDLKVKVRCGCSWRRKIAGNTALVNALGAKSWRMALWELVPLSFAVNWFVNVDTILKSLDLSGNILIDKTWQSYKIEATTYIVFESAEYGSPRSLATSEKLKLGKGDRHFVKTETHYARTRLPGLQAYVDPWVDINLTPAKLLDLAAILGPIGKNLFKKLGASVFS